MALWVLGGQEHDLSGPLWQVGQEHDLSGPLWQVSDRGGRNHYQDEHSGGGNPPRAMTPRAMTPHALHSSCPPSWQISHTDIKYSVWRSPGVPLTLP